MTALPGPARVIFILYAVFGVAGQLPELIGTFVRMVATGDAEATGEFLGLVIGTALGLAIIWLLLHGISALIARAKGRR